MRDYGTATWDGGEKDCDHSQYLGGNGEKSKKQVTSAGTQKYNYKNVCKKCGAVRIDNQLGLEKTPEEYVKKMVDVFREVKRVLRKDGTLWLNLGDSYASNPASGGSKSSNLNAKRDNDGCLSADNKSQNITPNSKYRRPKGLKPKDLVGIPWMVAFALRADGWYLRQDIIWKKLNPMPESVKDRCCKAHEYMFLLSKSQNYYFDHEAIKEESVRAGGNGNFSGSKKTGRNENPTGNEKRDAAPYIVKPTRNKRSVWTVTTKPFKKAHFATFPPKLIEPCVLAGCPKGGTVLDPFMGAGTVGLVAVENNRKYIGCELNPEYIKIAEQRILTAEPQLF